MVDRYRRRLFIYLHNSMLTRLVWNAIKVEENNLLLNSTQFPCYAPNLENTPIAMLFFLLPQREPEVHRIIS